MEDWVVRALKRWPNVPALYGWLALDRRGHWLIKGESITRPQIIEVINRNYSFDQRGCWYFQNGPQRGYMELHRAPLILHVASDALRTHTQLAAENISAAFLDEEGGLYLQTEQGPGALLDADLEWALARMTVGTAPVDDRLIAAALALPSGEDSRIALHLDGGALPLIRLDNARAPLVLKFVRNPEPTTGNS